MMDATRSPSAEITPRLPRGVRLRFDKVRDQWLLLGPERVFKLDQVGYQILSRLDGATSVAALVEDLAQSFDADPATIEADVRAYLTEMSDRGMVELE